MVRWCLFLAVALAVQASEIEYMSTQSSDEVSGFCEVAGKPDALTTAKGSFTEVCDDCDISAECNLSCKACKTVDVLGEETTKAASYDLTTGCRDIGYRAGKLLCAHVLTGEGVKTRKDKDGNIVVVSKEPKDLPSIDDQDEAAAARMGDAGADNKKRGLMFAGAVGFLLLVFFFVRSRSSKTASTPAPAPAATTESAKASPKKKSSGWFGGGNKEEWIVPKDSAVWAKQTGSIL